MESRRSEIKLEGRAATGRKADVRMQLITTAVFAVGKILRIRIGNWDIRSSNRGGGEGEGFMCTCELKSLVQICTV